MLAKLLLAGPPDVMLLDMEPNNHIDIERPLAGMGGLYHHQPESADRQPRP